MSALDALSEAELNVLTCGLVDELCGADGGLYATNVMRKKKMTVIDTLKAETVRCEMRLENSERQLMAMEQQCQEIKKQIGFLRQAIDVIQRKKELFEEKTA